MSRRRTKRRRPSAIISLLLAAVAAIGGLVYYYWEDDAALAPPAEGTLTVDVIDVGQGDSILVTCGGQTALIDAGTSDSAEAIAAHLSSQKIDRLDYAFATHPHADHIGGMAKIVRQFHPKHFVMSDAVTETKTFENMLDAIEEAGCDASLACRGDSYQLGDATLSVLWPTKDTGEDDLNNLSLVMLLTFGNKRFLLTGDAEATVESQLIELGGLRAVDVLKVGHHGSNTSSTEQLLNVIRPQYAAISLGADNEYGHPHEVILSRFAERNMEVYRTDRNGTIRFTVKDGELLVTTAK